MMDENYGALGFEAVESFSRREDATEKGAADVEDDEDDNEDDEDNNEDDEDDNEDNNEEDEEAEPKSRVNFFRFLTEY